MPDIVPSNTIRIEDELTNLSLLKYHPNGILNTSLNRLKDMLDGRVEIVDPANPFIYLLETSCLNTAFAIQEYTLLTRKLYPRLATSEKDLYLHMSDVDYLGRFSEPAKVNVLFNILFNDFKDKAKYNPIQKEYVLKLPRHLKLSVDDYVFTLMSAIDIRLTESGVIDVKYENQDFNSVFPVTTNYLNFNMFKVNQEETYLHFNIDLPEIDIETVEIPIEKSKLFKKELKYNPKRDFYFFRGFYQKDGIWKEMIVTHTDEIYDINEPTCIIKVYPESKSLEYYIPPVYVNSDMVGNKIKFLIYTTKGTINVNFKDYKISDFKVEYGNVFPDIELDEFTQPLHLITKVIYITDEVNGGKNSLTFEELKRSVISNSIGDRKLPITNKQLEFEAYQNNFKLIKDVDNVSNRIYLLEIVIPNPTTRYPVTKFNLEILEYMTSINDMVTNKNNIVRINDRVTLIPEGTIFIIENSKLRLLDNTEYEQLISLSGLNLTTTVNTNKYVSVYYHYVLDTSDNKTELRAYDISRPLVERVNFKQFNATTRVGINTMSANIYKSTNGYTLDIISNLKKYVATITEVNIKPYLVYTENNSRFFLEGRLVSMLNESPLYRFDIDSGYYIDTNDKLEVRNFKDINGNTMYITIDMNTKLDLIYISNVIPSNFISEGMDWYIHNSYLAVGNCVVTSEELNIKIGDRLDRLFRRVHTSTGVMNYETWNSNVPMRYKTNVYNSDNTIRHMINEIVYDQNGDVVYEFMAGDIKLDENGKPIEISRGELVRYINLLLIDYRCILSTKTTTKEYAKYLKEYITDKIVVDVNNINNLLLDNTESFVVVPKSVNTVKVKVGDRVMHINSMQVITVNVYVTERVYLDIDSKNNIQYSIVKLIDEYLYSNVKLNRTELLNSLYVKLKEVVISISIEKFTEVDGDLIEILDNNSRLSLDKELVAEMDGYNLQEKIVVNFKLSS